MHDQINIKLPALVGSEKQVKWAEDIRAEAFGALTCARNNLEREYRSLVGETAEDESAWKLAEAHCRYSKKDVDTIENILYQLFEIVTSASKFIDLRRTIDYDRVMEMIRREHRDGSVSRSFAKTMEKLNNAGGCYEKDH